MTNLFVIDGAEINGEPPEPYVQVADSVGVAETSDADMVAFYGETAGVGETSTDSVTAVFTAAESLGIGEAVQAAFDLLGDDSLLATEAATFALTLALVESVLVEELAATPLEATVAVATAVVLSETAQFGYLLTAEDSVLLTEQLAQALSGNHELTESVLAAETLAQAAVMYVELAETAGVGETATHQGDLVQALEEGLSVFVSLVIGADVYAGWVLNTHTLGASRYSDLPFNSMVEFNGQYLGASEAGIFEMTGSDDAGTDFRPGVKTGQLDFGSRAVKGIEHLEVGVKSSGQLVVKFTVSDGQTVREVWHELHQSTVIGGNAETPVAKGLRGVFWQAELVPLEASSDFDIEGIQFFPVQLTRGR